MCDCTKIQEGYTMKKTKIIGALLAGVMAVSGISLIPDVSSPFVIEAEAASKLAAPTGLKATVSGTTVKLSWNAVKGADGYRVYQFNSESGEYETLKNVAATSTSVKGLAKGTYNFRIAAVVKSGSKLKVQTKTSPVKAKVTGTTTTTKSSGALIQFPAFGTSGKKAVQALGLKNYQYGKSTQKGVTAGVYAGTMKINGKDVTIGILEDTNGVYFGGMAVFDSKFMSFANAAKKLNNSLGKPIMDMNVMGMDMYMWANEKTEDIYTLMGADMKEGSFGIYYALSFKYAPEEMKKGKSIKDFQMPDFSGLLG